MRFDAAVTATIRVRSESAAATASVAISPVAGSKSTQRTVAPARSAACTHGRTFVVVEPGDDHLVSRAPHPGEMPREVVGQLRRAAAVHDASRVAVHEVGHREPEPVHCGLGAFLGLADRAAIRKRTREHGCHRVAHCPRRLGAARPVEVSPAALERRELGADARDVVGHSPQPNHAEPVVRPG